MTTFKMSDLAKSLKKEMSNKNSNRLIRRAGTFEPGSYAVTIAAVDTAKIEAGQITVTFETIHREQHNQIIWMTNFEGDGLSDGLEALLYGLFGSSEQTLEVWLDFLSKPENVNHAFQLMRGMKLTVSIGETEGFIITCNAGKYSAMNNKTNEVLSGPFSRRMQAKRTALSNGHKEPKSILLDSEPTHADDNQQTIRNAIKAITSTQTSGDNNEVRLEAVK
jgi:hypothetical protein